MSKSNTTPQTAQAGNDVHASTDKMTSGNEHPAELTTRIVTAVAEAIDADPMELPPLYDTIDPTIVEQVLENGHTTNHHEITVTYEGVEVTINSDGGIDVEDKATTSDSETNH